MKFVRFMTEDGKVGAGEWLDGDIYALNGSPEAIFAGDIQPERGEVIPNATLLPPTMPGKLLCVGKNYAAHAAEMNSVPPENPLIFAKFPTCVIGDGEPIQWSEDITQQVDWEGELVIVIGKTASKIDEADASEHIFGYTVANDVSARDLQSSESQWARAKGMDTFCPLGPWIVTHDNIAAPNNLNIKTVVNGETMQDGNTEDLIFKIPFLVAYLSQTFTLNPGDIILTGTPPGVGKGRKPPVFLKDGDVVSVTIEQIGTIENTCQVI
ncbi:MAG: fumarylacetoacetate hydrolase family protein [Aggregatilineales bacterium]